MTQLLQHLQQQTACHNLVLAGGCALNSAYNGQIKSRTDFTQVYIPSAPADDGTALGAAWLALRKKQPDLTINSDKNLPLSPYLGSTISTASIEKFVANNRCLNVRYLPGEICKASAELLAQGQLIGWIQGRAEFGPRALGNRSILADPRHAETKDHINRKIKFRESFRPFAPAVLDDYAEQFFADYHESPYMDKTLSIKEDMQHLLGAVCHVDGTGRLQSVKQEWNPLFYELIHCFYQRTEMPILLNTSFNVMGKPLVHTLEDALGVFLNSGLDSLVVNDYLISKPL